MLSSQKNKSSSLGFTLIEIMVATVIMIILVGLVVQITSSVLQVWNKSSGKLAANAEARIAMDLLTQDLETAVFRNNNKQWLSVEGAKNPAGEVSDYTDQTVAVKLFSPALDRDTGESGDICAIAYRLAFQPAYEGAKQNTYVLYRKLIGPEKTFDKVMGSSGDETQDRLDDTDYWGDTAIIQDEHYLASNIVEFKVLIYTLDAAGNVYLENATDDLKINSNYSFGGPSDTTSSPIYADIILTVVSDEGLRLLQEGKFTGTGFEDATDVVTAHGQTFTRRVNFLARPL